MAETLKVLEAEDFDISTLGWDTHEIETLFEGAAGGDDAEAGPIERWEGRFEVVVELKSEQEQQDTYERLSGMGYTCRVLTM